MHIQESNQGKNIRVLTIDRPPVNALDDEIVAQLSAAVQSAMSDPEVRVLIITGAGKCFVAGADIDRLLVCNRNEGREMVSRVKAFQSLLRKGSKPVIAAVNGMAAGGGLELAMACDIRIADQKALLGLPEATLGVIPGAGGTQMLPRLVGIGRALELMFSGKLIRAEEALRLGLVERVTAEGGALKEAMDLAEIIARNAPMALAEIKLATYDAVNVSLEKGSERETERFARMCDTEDKKEGITAFKSRRQAHFRGR